MNTHISSSNTSLYDGGCSDEGATAITPHKRLACTHTCTHALASKTTHLRGGERGRGRGMLRHSRRASNHAHHKRLACGRGHGHGHGRGGRESIAKGALFNNI